MLLQTLMYITAEIDYIFIEIYNWHKQGHVILYQVFEVVIIKFINILMIVVHLLHHFKIIYLAIYIILDIFSHMEQETQPNMAQEFR